MKKLIKKTFDSFSKDYSEQTALKLLEISMPYITKNLEIEKLETEIIELKTKIEALEQDKIYSKKIESYGILGNREVYFSQDELELYLRVMYQNIIKNKYSIGINKLAEKTNLDPEVIKAIRLKLIDDGIIKVSGMKTEILKYLNTNLKEEKETTFEELQNKKSSSRPILNKVYFDSDDK